MTKYTSASDLLSTNDWLKIIANEVAETNRLIRKYKPGNSHDPAETDDA